MWLLLRGPLINLRLFKTQYDKIAKGVLICSPHISTTANTSQQSRKIRLPDVAENLFVPPWLQKLDKEYVSTFVDILKDFTDEYEGEHVNEVKHHLVRAVKHTTLYDRLAAGHAIIDVYKLLELPEKLSPKNVNYASIVSWCAAMLCGAISLQDDIMDGAQYRNGYRSWNSLDNIGLTAINDSLLIENLVYIILKRYLSNHQCYIKIVDVFHEATIKTSIGQAIDLLSTVNGKPRFELFTKERLQELANYKCNWFCYQFPIIIGLHLTGKYDQELYAQAANIAISIGSLLQAQNDVLDAFGKFEVLRNPALDIQLGKCTWLAIETLHRGTSAQKKIFLDHYGKPFLESEQIILKLYRDLKLSEVYRELEKEKLRLIYKAIEQLSDRMPPKIFYNMIADLARNTDNYD